LAPPTWAPPREVVQSPHAPPPWRSKKVSFIVHGLHTRGSRIDGVRPVLGAGCVLTSRISRVLAVCVLRPVCVHTPADTPSITPG
jgi:hypothetical protein